MIVRGRFVCSNRHMTYRFMKTDFAAPRNLSDSAERSLTHTGWVLRVFHARWVAHMLSENQRQSRDEALPSFGTTCTENEFVGRGAIPGGVVRARK